MTNNIPQRNKLDILFGFFFGAFNIISVILYFRNNPPPELENIQFIDLFLKDYWFSIIIGLNLLFIIALVFITRIIGKETKSIPYPTFTSFWVFTFIFILFIIFYSTFFTFNYVVNSAENISLEQQKKYNRTNEAFIKLKDYTLHIDNDLKYIDLLNRYEVELQDDKWIIDYNWSTLDWMIFRDKVNLNSAKIIIIRYENTNLRDLEKFSDYEFQKIYEGEEPKNGYFTWKLDDTAYRKIDDRSVKIVEFNSTYLEKYGYSSPLFSYGKNYLLILEKDDGFDAYQIITESFGDDFVEAKEVFNNYISAFDFVLENLEFFYEKKSDKIKDIEGSIEVEGYGIIISHDDKLEGNGALYEVYQAKEFNYNAIIYKKDEWYATIIGPYSTREEANLDIDFVKENIDQDAYIVNLNNYCSNYIQQEEYRECISE